MIDVIIVFSYLSLLLIIGIVKRTTGGNFKSFSRITKGVKGNKLLLVATIFASTIGGGTTFGISEKAFSETIAHSYGLLIAMPIDLLIAIYIVPKLIQHYGSETIGDIMSADYGLPGRYIGGLSAILVSIGLLAAQISVSGRIFEYILQVDYVLGVTLSYGIVVIYTTIGGLQSVLFTNLLQFFAMIVAIPIITIFGIYQIGFDKFIASVPLDKVSFLDNPDLLGLTISAALGFSVINLLPTFIQRALINKDSKTTTNAIIIKTGVYVIFLVFVTINGLIAYIQYPDIKASLALPYLIDHIIPVGVQGIVVIGLLAAVMSTADSDLNVTSITIVKDIFNPLFSVKNQNSMLMLARIMNVLIGSIAIVIALCFSKVVDLVIFVVGFWSPIVLVPMIFGLFGITISKRNFVISCATGALTFVLWQLYLEEHFYLKGVFVGTIAHLLIFLAFYFAKRIDPLHNQ